MKVTIEFENELAPAITEHLATGVSVQKYIKAAIRYFAFMLEQENLGQKCGYGKIDVFTRYGNNKEVSPSSYLGRKASKMEVEENV